MSIADFTADLKRPLPHGGVANLIVVENCKIKLACTGTNDNIEESTESEVSIEISQ